MLTRIVVFFVVLLSAGLAAAQTQTEATGFPIPMDGGLMNSLELSGYNVRLYTELHRDSCQGPLINREEQNSFKKGEVLYLCQDATVNQARINEFMLWANTAGTHKVAHKALPTADQIPAVKTAESQSGKPIGTAENAAVAKLHIDKNKPTVTNNPDIISLGHAAALTAPQLRTTPPQQYSEDNNILYQYILFTIFALIPVFILIDCRAAYKRHINSVNFITVLADYFPDRLESLKELLMFLGRKASKKIWKRWSPALGSKLYRFFDTATAH